jgi:MFS family permease
MLILAAIFLPEIKPRGAEQNPDGETVSRKKAPMGKKFWATLIAFTFFSFTYGIIGFFTSTYVAENSLGTEAYAGLLVSLGTVGSFFFCLAFGLIYRKLGQGSAVPTYIFFIGAMILFWLFPDRIVAIVLSTLAGGAFGVAFTYVYSYCPTVIPETRIGDGMGFITATYGIAGFLLPYIVNAIQKLLRTESITTIFGVGAAFSVVALVIQLVTIAGNRTTKTVSGEL